MLYRVLRALDAGSKRGIIQAADEHGRQVITDLEWLNRKQRKALVNCGAVAPVAPPPLNVLPGWRLRAGKLVKFGIETAVDLLETDAEWLANCLGYRASTVKRWQREVREYLVPKVRVRRG
jgi:hypothetical protein